MKKFLVKFSIFGITVLTISYIVFINLGKFFDVTKKPQNVDVIVCLGGGSGERLRKSAELYNRGYSKTGIIILTGGETIGFGKHQYNKTDYLIGQGVPAEAIVYLNNTSNTMKEVLALRTYLQQHRLHSVMFVSDPPHSRRIRMLADTIAEYADYGLHAYEVSSDPAWWHANRYYENKKALGYVVAEVLKLPTNYIAYNILEPLGLYGVLREQFGETIHFIKHYIHGQLRL